MRIAVLGSGAMGSVIGGHMALAGLDVTYAQGYALARPGAAK